MVVKIPFPKPSTTSCAVSSAGLPGRAVAVGGMGVSVGVGDEPGTGVAVGVMGVGVLVSMGV